MEIKDLILLLAIPVLLIGILLSLGKIPSITGAAIAEEANQKLGEYLIMPSFKAKIDYNMEEEYSKLKMTLKKIIDDCKSQENMEDCISKKTSEGTEIKWKCEEKDEDVLYDFADKLKDCARLQDNSVCRLSFDRRDYINKVKAQRTFEIKLTNWYPPRAKIELLEDEKLLAIEFAGIGKLDYSDDRENSAKNANSITIKVLFNDGIPTVQEAYASTDSSPKVDLSRLILLYKSSGVHFIDAAVETNFRIPQNKVIILPNIKGMKFCAKTGKQILAYYSSDNSVKMRDIVYKFAVTFPKSPPKPLDSIEALDALKAENGIILSWAKPNQDDIESYSIYYSENDFFNKKISDIKKDETVKKIQIESENSAKIEKIDMDQCNFDTVGSPCKYYDYGSPLIAGKLYYLKFNNKLTYLIKDTSLIDEKQYYFAVTAVNSQGEILNDKSIDKNTNVLSEGRNYAKATPIDDLAPGKVSELSKIKTPDGKIKITWKRPSQNIDGTDSNDIAGYRIYYKKSISDINPQLEPGHNVKQITAADAKCDTVSLFCEYFIENIANLEKGQSYNFAVIAIDEKENEYNSESERIFVQIE